MISSSKQITTEWLESVLQSPIARIVMHENPAFNSSVIHLDVTYASATKHPHHILVKLNREHDGQNEVQFYRFTEGMELPMIPRQLAMDYDPQSGLSFLVLEDLSETHTGSVTREQLKALNGVPAAHHLEMIVDCIAQFHAAFWEHPQLGTIPGTTEMRWWYRDAEFHARHVERRHHEWMKFVDMYKNELPCEWLALGQYALNKLPGLFESRIQPRLKTKQALTISQGDCYLTQFLVPRKAPGQAYLIDFQDTCLNFPAYDLVYMFATFWTREQRAVHEESLLWRYQNELRRRGVPYDWDLLKDDYLLSLSYMLFDAIWNATAGSGREYWMPKLKCLIEAYQDWKCAEL
jgi:hypothetical protein